MKRGGEEEEELVILDGRFRNPLNKVVILDGLKFAKKTVVESIGFLTLHEQK